MRPYPRRPKPSPLWLLQQNKAILWMNLTGIKSRNVGSSAAYATATAIIKNTKIFRNGS